ncbi:MAG TPA: hypothetical protein VD999_06855 [Vitreimonas sp.]|nr:hypothetical protein [Vitreimonas sp.]
MSEKLPLHFIPRFQAYIYHFFDNYGRHDLPWRQNYDPYRIMVSEIMLQQTQVERVIPKYLAFLEKFPTVAALATAPQSQVIQAWQGLGYNRRGLNLQRAAQSIVADHNGHFPDTEAGLLALPGIGPYTAAAIRAFAFNQPSIVIETNIRTLFIFHFFPEAYNVEDLQLLPLIEATLDHKNPRRWYSALMDYGSYLKKVIENPTRRSKTYSKQAPLAGSNREARGLILKVLATHPVLSYPQLEQHTLLIADRLQPALDQLLREGFLKQIGDNYSLAD